MKGNKKKMVFVNALKDPTGGTGKKKSSTKKKKVKEEDSATTTTNKSPLATLQNIQALTFQHHDRISKKKAIELFECLMQAYTDWETQSLYNKGVSLVTEAINQKMESK